MPRLVEPLLNKAIFKPVASTYTMDDSFVKVALIPQHGWAGGATDGVVDAGRTTVDVTDTKSAEDPSTFIVPVCVMDAPRPTEPSWIIVHGHGTGGDAAKARLLYKVIQRSVNATIIAVEYPGYAHFPPLKPTATQSGTSSSYSWERLAPCEEGLHLAFDSVIWDLIHRQKIDPSRIISAGRSMGTGPATRAAVQFNLGGLIFYSGYTSIDQVARDKFEAKKNPLVRQAGLSVASYPIFNNTAQVAKIQCPVVVIHGAVDPLIKVSHAESIFHSIPHQQKALHIDPEGTHTEIAVFNDAVREFFSNLLSSPCPPDSSAVVGGVEFWSVDSRVKEELERRRKHANKLWWAQGVVLTASTIATVGGAIGAWVWGRRATGSAGVSLK